MNTVTQFGLDLAKNSFAIYGGDRRHGGGQWCPLLGARAGEARPRCEDHCPEARCPYRRQGATGKNDANDAAAICEAAGRPRMRFVPIKSAEQQATLVVHRLRAATVAEYTRTVNQMRGRLAEVLGIGVTSASARVATLGNGHDFNNARQFAAWLGLVPRQYSTGGQVPAGSHLQAWRYLPSHTTRARGQKRAQLQRRARRQEKPVGGEAQGIEILEQGRRGTRQQARPYRLGDPGEGVYLSTHLRAARGDGDGSTAAR
ncbi:MAG: transposase [Gammaproteobacteria bacterium]|nr:transposase [Gammaproteobacteria bacterium]